MNLSNCMFRIGLASTATPPCAAARWTPYAAALRAPKLPRCSNRGWRLKELTFAIRSSSLQISSSRSTYGEKFHACSCKTLRASFVCVCIGRHMRLRAVLAASRPSAASGKAEGWRGVNRRPLQSAHYRIQRRHRARACGASGQFPEGFLMGCCCSTAIPSSENGRHKERAKDDRWEYHGAHSEIAAAHPLRRCGRECAPRGRAAPSDGVGRAAHPRLEEDARRRKLLRPW